MKLNEFLQQYFNTKIKKIEELNEFTPDLVKYIFIEGFKAGYSFDFHITLDLNKEIIEVNSLKKELPILLKEFFEEWR
ncbi:hypothetical protein [Marinitoga sp. 1155]|uniref:hypothetical protein n=1 Tax=Marinitoga sp. 1155 TaxID=1428448 RepID=UPI0006412803|nr:hypothetical protein [Marinitoga sp. 1155]AMS33984.1 hypothetical protein UF09_68 [Marinitoga camini virus 2]KLO24793.1 hypothetical protein X274_02240 [Marinitoga sp. 1155]